MSPLKRRQGKLQMVTLEDWLREIQHVRDSLDLIVSLLSSSKNWDFKTKI